jgi:hypothetical protein
MDILRVEGLGIKILKLELKLIKIFEVKLNINITGLLLISQESNKRFEDLDHLFLITFFLVLEISFKSLVDGTNEFFSDVFLCIIIGFFSFLGSSCGLTHCFVLFCLSLTDFLKGFLSCLFVFGGILGSLLLLGLPFLLSTLSIIHSLIDASLHSESCLLSH